jgi:hypothetical protein
MRIFSYHFPLKWLLVSWTLAAAILTIVPTVFWADNDNRAAVPPFDFTDTFYSQNGINPANIQTRVDGSCPTTDMPSCSVVDTSNTDPDRRGIRVLSTTGGFDHEGNPLYYSIFGMVNPNTFTADAAGLKALQIAEFFSAYIFPKASGNPLSPALSNRRQDNVFDTRHGYFVANPLGLWTAVFVSYTCAATGMGCPETAVCKSALKDLAMKNGTDLDGTPQIHKAIEVDDLGKKGCAVERTRPFDGSQGFPWII